MDIKTGDLINDRYEVIKEIGRGATASVFLVKDITLNEERALKVEKGQDSSKSGAISNVDRRFSLEAKAMMQFDNKNIVKVYEFFKHNGKQVIVLEYVKGKSLDQVLKEKNSIPSKQTAMFAIQVLNALKDIHKKGFYHRDLKPANIMLTYDNQIKLMDFGVVQVSEDQELTKQNNIIGTLAYVAPEIIRHHQKASQQTEIWAVGVMLYKMVTGILPFDGTNHNRLAGDIISKNPILPSNLNPDIDPRLEKIILKMLRKDYFERYSSAESAMDALVEYIQKPKATRAVVENKTTTKAKLGNKLWIWVTLVGVGVIGALVVIILALVNK